jgi:hypothetical protein
MNRSKQGDMGIKTVVVLVMGLALVSVHSAELDSHHHMHHKRHFYNLNVVLPFSGSRFLEPSFPPEKGAQCPNGEGRPLATSDRLAGCLIRYSGNLLLFVAARSKKAAARCHYRDQP